MAGLVPRIAKRSSSLGQQYGGAWEANPIRSIVAANIYPVLRDHPLSSVVLLTKEDHFADLKDKIGRGRFGIEGLGENFSFINGSHLATYGSMKWPAFFVLLTALIWAGGCATPKPDPLAGWKAVDYKHEPDQVVEKDYRDYLDNLPPQERMAARPADYLEDGTGQHAIVIEVALNGTWWRHVLIYDKDNHRAKVIKYPRGRYRC